MIKFSAVVAVCQSVWGDSEQVSGEDMPLSKHENRAFVETHTGKWTVGVCCRNDILW